jgi:NTE family protein
VTLVADLRTAVRAGVRKSPRVRLLASFTANLRMWFLLYPLSCRMATLYQRYFFSSVTQRRQDAPLPLHALRVEYVTEIDSHNDLQGHARVSDRVPKLILNATSLNSGAPFMFSAAEVGAGYRRVRRPAGWAYATTSV